MKYLSQKMNKIFKNQAKPQQLEQLFLNKKTVQFIKLVEK